MWELKGSDTNFTQTRAGSLYFQSSHLLNEVATVVLVRKSKQAASAWWIQIQ